VVARNCRSNLRVLGLVAEPPLLHRFSTSDTSLTGFAVIGGFPCTGVVVCTSFAEKKVPSLLPRSSATVKPTARSDRHPPNSRHLFPGPLGNPSYHRSPAWLRRGTTVFFPHFHLFLPPLNQGLLGDCRSFFTGNSPYQGL